MKKEMNFYDVRIGTTTRKGHFNECVNFVCSSNLNSSYELTNHLQRSYKGFKVLVKEVENIIEIKTDKASKDDSVLKKQIGLLEDKIWKLEKTEKTRILKGSIRAIDCSEDIEELAKKIRDQEKELNKNIDAIGLKIRHYLKGLNKNIAESVNKGDEEYDIYYGEYHYKIKLKGNLITHKKTK